MKGTRIAILGAGCAGVCASLELARRGYSVDLYDENLEAISRASFRNEGKIHLGLVYARDRSLKTAETMIVGAVHFAACLSRWIDIQPADLPLSTPYYYVVHKGTISGVGELEDHYLQCKRLFAEICDATGLCYLGDDRTLSVERVSDAEMEALVSPDHCEYAFRTSERAVDPRVMAERLRAALVANSRVRFVSDAHVTEVAWAADGRLQVSFLQGGTEYREPYDQVANTLWHGRLQIDALLGLTPQQSWLYRYKLGGWLRSPESPTTIPSLTFVLGPFGDVVNFGSRGVYLSWYPSGMVGVSRDLKPPNWESSLSDGERQVILRRSYEELAMRCPALASLGEVDHSFEQAGGVIFAWGDTDIQYAGSRLHTRHEIGIQSVRNYHSVNTGKYTMGPYFGYKTAERILGIS